jgi:hypothetical protein
LIRKKSIQRAKCMKESLLHRVFRVLVRKHDCPADGVRAPLMQPHERSEGIATSLLSRHHQCPFVRAPPRISVR